MKCCAGYGFVQGRNELCGVVHLELITREYFILTSIAAKSLIRIKLERASPSPGPLRGPWLLQNEQFSAVRSHSSRSPV